MGEIKKVGKEYYIEFYARGLKYQQKGGERLADAERLLREIEAKIAKGEEAIIVRDVDLDIFFHDFFYFAATEHASATVGRYASVIKAFERFRTQTGISIQKLSEVTPSVIERWKAVGKGRPRSVNFSLLLFSDILQYGIKLGYINDDPTVHVRLSEMPQRRPAVLNDEQLAALKEQSALGPAVIDLMVLTGADTRELAALRFEDIDWAQNKIGLGSRRKLGRYGRYRSIPMHPRAAEILKERQQGAGSDLVFEKDLERAVNPAKREAGLTRTRHTFARDMIERGVRLSSLYKLLGFADIAMTAPYLIFRWEYLKKTVGA